MIKDLYCAKLLGQLLCNFERMLDDMQPLYQMNDPNVTLAIAFSFTKELIAETACLNLLHQPVWEVLRHQVLFEHHECHLSIVCGQVILLHNRLDVSRGGLANLQFQLVTRTKLVLDVLDGAEALKDSTFDHDSHLSGQGLSLLHRMSGQDYGALLSFLGEACDDLPHEATGFRIHA